MLRRFGLTFLLCFVSSLLDNRDTRRWSTISFVTLPFVINGGLFGRLRFVLWDLWGEETIEFSEARRGVLVMFHPTLCSMFLFGHWQNCLQLYTRFHCALLESTFLSSVDYFSWMSLNYILSFFLEFNSLFFFFKKRHRFLNK